jgi:tetratricopeptide (TPR) repeat protein
MRPGSLVGLVMMVGLGLALGACATAPPGPEVAAPPSKPSPLGLLVASHREKAEALERDGHLRRARDEWKIALTIKRDDAAAREGKRKLEALIEQAVSDGIRQGQEALGRGAQLQARRYFLAALALDPANRVAFEALQTKVKEVRFITHTVRPGETLAMLAERYYGDRSRSEVIWEINQLPPNSRLVAGTTLRIPEMPGLTFVQPESHAKVSREVPARGEETLESDPLLVEAREAFEKGEYKVALASVDKVLAGNPKYPEGIDLQKEILYRLGRSQFETKQYEDSYQTLTQLAKVAPNFQDSAALLRQVRGRLVQHYYSQGLRFFQEERLEEAIAQWRNVLQLDPGHASAKKNIEQAQRFLKALEERREK